MAIFMTAATASSAQEVSVVSNTPNTAAQSAQIQTLKSAIKATSTSLTQKIEDQDAKLTTLEGKVNSNVSKLNSLSSQMTSIVRRVQKLERYHRTTTPTPKPKPKPTPKPENNSHQNTNETCTRNKIETLSICPPGTSGKNTKETQCLNGRLNPNRVWITSCSDQMARSKCTKDIFHPAYQTGKDGIKGCADRSKRYGQVKPCVGGLIHWSKIHNVNECGGKYRYTRN